MKTPIPDYLDEVLEAFRGDTSGATADYIPELAAADPDLQDYTPSEFKNGVLALADTAKFFNLPAILTTSFEDGPNGPIVPELKETLPDAAYVARPGQINAWDSEEFVEAVSSSSSPES